MKTIFFSSVFGIMILAFSGHNALIAQTSLRPYVGVNSSRMTKALAESSEWKSGLGYQIGLDAQFGNKIFVQPGLQFEAFKSLQRTSIGGVTPESELTTSYLRIPVLVGYRFGEEEDAFGLRVFAGPNAAFRLSGKSNAQIGDVNIEDQLKSVIFGLSGGLGLDFLSIFFVDLGYQIGLSDVFEDVEGLNSGARNNFLYANAGIRARF